MLIEQRLKSVTDEKNEERGSSEEKNEGRRTTELLLGQVTHYGWYFGFTMCAGLLTTGVDWLLGSGQLVGYNYLCVRKLGYMLFTITEYNRMEVLVHLIGAL